jgi:hypothetical protein
LIVAHVTGGLRTDQNVAIIGVLKSTFSPWRLSGKRWQRRRWRGHHEVISLKSGKDPQRSGKIG